MDNGNVDFTGCKTSPTTKILLSIFSLLFLIQGLVVAQEVNLICQTEMDGFVGLDRNNFNSGSTANSSEGSMHNFDLPMNTFGDCKRIAEVEIVVTFNNVDQSGLDPACTVFSYFINSSVGCPSFAPASCDFILMPQPNGPPVTQTIQYFSPPETFPFGEVFTVDIVPAMGDPNCPGGQSTISSGAIIMDYEICVTVTIVDEMIDTPPDLGTSQTICPLETVTLDPGTYAGYEWGPNGETSPTIDVGPGNYTVTVTDVNGCTGEDNISILDFPSPPITFNPSMPTACGNGSVSVGIIESYPVYNWSNSMMTQNVMLTPGMYTVTVTDNNNCTAVASLDVLTVSPPNAGSDNTIDVCNDGSVYDIDALLLANDAGGTWTDDNASGVNININPSAVNFAGVAAGIYNFTYTVSGVAPCPSDEATITVAVFDQLNPGNPASLAVCTNPGNVDFFFLIGNPDMGGTWVDLDASLLDLSNPSLVNLDGLMAGTYSFEYQLGLGGPCPIQNTLLTITINEDVTAGFDNAITVCEGSQVDLFSLVNGANDTGTFTDTDGSNALMGSIFNTTGLSGQSFNFTFTVGSSMNPCGVDVAVFTVTVENSLSAGIGSTETLCSGAAINLFDFLSNADPGGLFIDVNNSGGLTSNTLNTAGIIPGTYIYRYEIGDGITCPQDQTEITLTFLEDPGYDFDLNNLTVCIDNCEAVQIDLTGTGPFDFPLNVYSATTGNLILSENISTVDNSFTFTTCNTADADNTYANDTLNLLPDSLWYIVLPSLQDVNCIFDDSDDLDTLFVTTLSYSTFAVDTSACITDTLVINGVQFFEGNASLQDTIPGMVCDSIIDIRINFTTSDTIVENPTICLGDSIFIAGIWFSELLPNATIDIVNSVGCDSVLIIDVDFFPSADSLIDLTLCTGDSIVVNGTTYNELLPFGMEEFPAASSNGCDSIVTIDLEFRDDISVMITDTLCADGSIDIAGMTYDINNPSDQVMLSGPVCDTLIDINLSFYEVADTMIEGSFCAGFELTVLGGDTYNQTNPSGSDTIPSGSQFGCDSIVNVNLTFFQPATSTINETTCDSITINGVVYNSNNTSGIDTISGGSINGCDSIITIMVLVNETSTSMNTATLCEGDSIFLAGAWQFVSGSYVDTLQNISLCDSIVTTELIVNPCGLEVEISTIDNICAGEAAGTLTLDIQSEIDGSVTIVWTGAATGNTGTEVINTATEVNITNLVSDTYTLQFFDENDNLIREDMVTIEDLNAPLSLFWTVIDPILCAGELGSIDFEAMGGSGLYTYTWSDPSIGTISTANDIAAGTYTLTVTDELNCSADSTITFMEPEALSAMISIMDLTCANAADGQITIDEITGGMAPYSVSFNEEIIEESTLENLEIGTYTLAIMDANDCSVEFMETLVASANSVFVNYTEEYSIEFGDSVALEGVVLDSTVTFEWMDDTGTLSCTSCAFPTAFPSTTTVYEVEITDALGCVQNASVTIEVTFPPVVDITPNVFSPNGDNQNDEFIFTSSDPRTTSLTLEIYDRWGNRVFVNESFENTITWDGFQNNTLMSNGVYVYKVIILLSDNSSDVKVGDVLLLN